MNELRDRVPGLRRAVWSSVVLLAVCAASKGAALTATRSLPTSTCLETLLESRTSYSFEILVGVTVEPTELIDSVELIERVPAGWGVDRSSLIASSGEVLDLPEGHAVAWLASGVRARCLLTSEPTPECAGLVRSPLSYRVFPHSSGLQSLTGTISYRGTTALGGLMTVDSQAVTGVLQVNCISAATVTRQVNGACRPAGQLSVVLHADFNEALGPTGMTLTEQPPPLSVASGFNPAAPRVGLNGDISWTRVSPFVRDGDFQYVVTLPDAIGSTAQFGGGGEGAALSRVSVKTQSGPEVTLPIRGTSEVACVSPPTPTPIPGRCTAPGQLGASCNQKLDTCVAGACRCVGDCDGDGKVTAAEIGLLRSLLARPPAETSACLAGDFNGDLQIRTNEITK